MDRVWAVLPPSAPRLPSGSPGALPLEQAPSAPVPATRPLASRKGPGSGGVGGKAPAPALGGGTAQARPNLSCHTFLLG